MLSDGIDASGPRANIIRWIFRITAVTLGALQAWVARNAINPDGRSHIEIAMSYLRHDWSMANNAYWGPLYSWILAAALGVTRPSLRMEFPVVHAVNFLLFVVCIVAFEFFWAELIRGSGVQKVDEPLPVIALWTMGFSLFIWLTTSLLVPLINADLLVAIIVFVDLALLVRIITCKQVKIVWFAFLGTVLGIGYLAKAVMFPLGFVFLTLIAAASKASDKRRYLVWSLLIFLLIAAPQIVLLSHSQGHFTFSESSKYPFAWSNYNLPIRNWQGQPVSSGKPLHPTRKIFDHPAVFEFNGPIRASYPPWYDPSFWNAGMSPPFNLDAVAQHAMQNVPTMAKFLLMPRFWLAGIVLILFFAKPRETAAQISRNWYLLAGTTVVFGLYLLTFWEYRYVPAWGIVAWGAIVGGIRIRPGKQTVVLWIAIVAAVLSTVQIAHGIYGQFRNTRADDATPDYYTAEGLKKMGVHTGEKIAAIGFDNDAYFAYLDRISIVAEINTEDTCEFWQASPTIQGEVMERLKWAGAQLVVANVGGAVRNTSHASPVDVAKCARPGPEWRKMDGSPNLVMLLN